MGLYKWWKKCVNYAKIGRLRILSTYYLRLSTQYMLINCTFATENEFRNFK